MRRLSVCVRSPAGAYGIDSEGFAEERKHFRDTGARVGQYALLRELGAGGMGRVFEAGRSRAFVRNANARAEQKEGVTHDSSTKGPGSDAKPPQAGTRRGANGAFIMD